MFYPDLTRRADYKRTRHGHYYSNYYAYKEEIDEDCQNRCAYCDITLEEHGGEGFQLDHFRPQAHFEILSNDPNNLVCSCPKCNRSKSDFWPENYPEVRFIEPFETNRVDLFEFADNGNLLAAKDSISRYQIELLNLNRPSRNQIRRGRLAKQRVGKLLELVDQQMASVTQLLDEHLTEGKPLDPKVTELVICCREMIQQLQALQ